MRGTRLVFAGIALVAVVLVVVAAGGVLSNDSSDGSAATGSAAEKNSVTITLLREPTTFDVLLREDGQAFQIAPNVLEALTTRDAEMNVKPGLAESWEQVDDTRWVFELREGVEFHNGEVFNAEAAEFVINYILDPDNSSEILAHIAGIESAKATGPNTLEIVTTGPDPNLPSKLYFVLMAPPEYVKADADALTRAPVGTGPYRFESWEGGRQIELTRFDGYWGTKPPIEHVKVLWRGEPQVRLAALQAGETSVAPLDPEQVPEAPSTTTAVSTEVSELLFDARPGRTLEDKRLRLAINLAIDRAQLLEFVFKGHAAPTKGQVVPPSAHGYFDDLEDYPFDLEQAKQLVTEAGAVGKEVTLVAPPARYPAGEATARAITEMINATGLKVKLEMLEYSRVLDRLFDKGSKDDLYYIAVGSDELDASHSIRTLLVSPDKGGVLSRYSNPKIDALYEEAIHAPTLEEKEAVYRRVWEEAQEDVGLMPVAILENIWGKVDGLEWAARPDNRLLAQEMSWR